MSSRKSLTTYLGRTRPVSAAHCNHGLPVSAVHGPSRLLKTRLGCKQLVSAVHGPSRLLMTRLSCTRPVSAAHGPPVSAVHGLSRLLMTRLGCKRLVSAAHDPPVLAVHGPSRLLMTPVSAANGSSRLLTSSPSRLQPPPFRLLMTRLSCKRLVSAAHGASRLHTARLQFLVMVLAPLVAFVATRVALLTCLEARTTPRLTLARFARAMKKALPT